MDLAFIGHILLNAGLMRFHWQCPFTNDEQKIKFCSTLYLDTHYLIQLRILHIKSHKNG